MRKGRVLLRKFFEKRKLIILLLGLITSLSLVCYSAFGPAETLTPVTWINDFTSMFARVISQPGNMLMNFADSVGMLQNTYEENMHLKKQIGSLQELKAQNQILKADNREMSNLLDMKPTLHGKKVLAGSVISRSPDYWNDYLIINLGSRHGLKQGMSVLAGNGLIGRVAEASPTSSKVELLTAAMENNVEVAANVQLDDAIVHGIIKSYDKRTGELLLTQVAKDFEIKKGRQVVTSGLGGVSPEGLIIGKVVSAKPDEFGLSQTVRVKAAGNFDDIRHVLVVLQTSDYQEHEEDDATAGKTKTEDDDLEEGEADAGQNNA